MDLTTHVKYYIFLKCSWKDENAMWNCGFPIDIYNHNKQSFSLSL